MVQNSKQLIPHLFRLEFSKITAVLCKRFGIDHIQVAEDIASETFAVALETWPRHGIPPDPVAWLYQVAANRTRNYLKRGRIFSEKIADQLTSPVEEQNAEIDLSGGNITDSQLRMLFALSHPSIPSEAQIGLSLRILCGFGIDEIANAFLTNKQTINKRLYRAREKLRTEKVQLEFPGDQEIHERLDTVLKTLYLLFSEGYHSESHEEVLRKDLCLEAMRLTHLLTENEKTNQPKVYALLSLMCFHTSRFEARKNEKGEMVLYQDQDQTRWNQQLMARGAEYLNKSARGSEISKYHLEANIAYWHTIKEDTSEKWNNILQLYNQLLVIEYSPMAALNQTYALSKVNGKQKAITEAEKLNLKGNHYYFTLLGELYTGVNNKQAQQHFEKARDLAKTTWDLQVIETKLEKIYKKV